MKCVIINKLISASVFSTAPDDSMAYLLFFRVFPDDIHIKCVMNLWFFLCLIKCQPLVVFGDWYSISTHFSSFYSSILKIFTRRKMSNDFVNHHIPHTHTSDEKRMRHAHEHTQNSNKFQFNGLSHDPSIKYPNENFKARRHNVSHIRYSNSIQFFQHQAHHYSASFTKNPHTKHYIFKPIANKFLPQFFFENCERACVRVCLVHINCNYIFSFRISS